MDDLKKLFARFGVREREFKIQNWSHPRDRARILIEQAVAYYGPAWDQVAPMFFLVSTMPPRDGVDRLSARVEDYGGAVRVTEAF